MIVRKLEQTDAIGSARLFAIAYEASVDVASAADCYRPDITWGAFVDGVLTCQIQNIPYTMQFDGHWAPMGGVAGVSTLPQHRRQGGVRAIFSELFPAMREMGQVFSVLFPFSYAFYRKFGYEAVYRVNKLTMPVSLLSHLPRPQNVRMYEPGQDIEPFVSIYKCYTEGRNLAVHRPTERWQSDDQWRGGILPTDPWKQRRYAYVIDGDDGAPAAYLVFTPGDGEGGRRLCVRDWATTGAAGLRSLLGFVGSFQSHFQLAEIEVPWDLTPDLVMDEYHELRCQATWAGMTRVVDVETALRLMRWPTGPGRAVIRILDDCLEWNDATFLSEFEAGEAGIARCSQEPDITVDVRTLARLMMGTVDLAGLSGALLPGLDIANGAGPILQSIFPRKCMVMNERF